MHWVLGVWFHPTLWMQRYGSYTAAKQLRCVCWYMCGWVHLMQRGTTTPDLTQSEPRSLFATHKQIICRTLPVTGECMPLAIKMVHSLIAVVQWHWSNMLLLVAVMHTEGIVLSKIVITCLWLCLKVHQFAGFQYHHLNRWLCGVAERCWHLEQLGDEPPFFQHLEM